MPQWGILYYKQCTCLLVDQGHGNALQADIYSLGVLLWEIVTAEIPERGRMRPVQVGSAVLHHMLLLLVCQPCIPV